MLKEKKKITYHTPHNVISKTRFCEVNSSAISHVSTGKLAEGAPQSDTSIDECGVDDIIDTGISIR